jgi:hypothetical protein
MDKDTKRIVEDNSVYLIGVILIVTSTILVLGAYVIHLLEQVGLW